LIRLTAAWTDAALPASYPCPACLPANESTVFCVTPGLAAVDGTTPVSTGAPGGRTAAGGAAGGLAAASAPGGVAGGVRGGVAGGVAGGIAGGVVAVAGCAGGCEGMPGWTAGATICSGVEPALAVVPGVASVATWPPAGGAVVEAASVFAWAAGGVAGATVEPGSAAAVPPAPAGLSPVEPRCVKYHQAAPPSAVRPKTATTARATAAIISRDVGFFGAAAGAATAGPGLGATACAGLAATGGAAAGGRAG